MAFICASTRLNSKYIQRPFKFFTRRCASGNVAGSSTYCVISEFLQTFLCSSNATLQPGEILQRSTIYKAKKRLLNVGKCTGTYSLRLEWSMMCAECSYYFWSWYEVWSSMGCSFMKTTIYKKYMIFVVTVYYASMW